MGAEDSQEYAEIELTVKRGGRVVRYTFPRVRDFTLDFRNNLTEPYRIGPFMEPPILQSADIAMTGLALPEEDGHGEVYRWEHLPTPTGDPQ